MGRRVTDHNKQINDIQLSKDMNLLVAASKDFTAKVCVVGWEEKFQFFVVNNLTVKETYNSHCTHRPI